MSYNGSGTFQINSSGQPVVTGTVISSTAFNALTADLATGLSTAITKDGQTTTTSRIAFAQGVSSTLTTDATSATTGSIITAGGISCQKQAVVGTLLGVGGVPPAGVPIYVTATGAYVQLNSTTGGYSSVTGFDSGTQRWSIGQAGGNYGNGISFFYGTTEGMRLDSGGRLGIGVTPTSGVGTVQAIADSNNYGFTAYRAGNTVGYGLNGIVIALQNSSSAVVPYAGVGGIIATNTAGSHNGNMVFNVAQSGAFTEVGRFTNTGMFMIGSTSTSNAQAGTVFPLGYRGRAGYNGSETNTFNIAWTGSAANLWIDTSNFGAITTSSDYRIKKNIQTQTLAATDRIMKLRPVTYEIADYGDLFKADGIQREGFIAHEVQDVIPSGAEGYKDEENRIQSLRTDAILAVVVKAIQELTTRLAALENK